MFQGFLFRMPTAMTKDKRKAMIRSLLEDLWTHRFTIRNEAHGVPIPELGDESPDEYFDVDTLPLAWTKWLDIPDNAPLDASLLEKDSMVTGGTVDLCRQNSRKQSALMHSLMDTYWAVFLKEATGSNLQMLQEFNAKGDVSKLQRLVSVAIDGFEEVDEFDDVSVGIDKELVLRLRDFVLYFLHNPTSDSASGFNANIKKRVVQWYRDNPDPSDGTTVRYTEWNTLLIRTPAARGLTKLLETRRFFARSHRPMTVSYNKVATICRYIFEQGDVWEKAVAVMFSLGVRPNELFRDFVEFTPLSKKEVKKAKYTAKSPLSWILQKGASKGANASKLMLMPNSEAGDSEKRVAIKPILFGFKSPDIVEAIHQLRLEAEEEFKAVWGDMKMSEVPTSSLSVSVVQKLTKTMYRVMQEEADDCTDRGHLFGGNFSRKFYACAALKEFEDAWSGNTTPNQFVAEILLHQPGLPTDSVHYVTMELRYGEGDEESTVDDLFEEGTLIRRIKKKVPTSLRKTKTEVEGPLFTQTDEEIILKTNTKEKEKVKVFKFKHRRFVSEDERQEYFAAVKLYLTGLNVLPSISNLTKLGLSPQFQAARKKYLKAAQIELEKKNEDVQEMSDEVHKLEEEVKGFEESDSEDTEDELKPTPLERGQMTIGVSTTGKRIVEQATASTKRKFANFLDVSKTNSDKPEKAAKRKK